ncbi:putative MscS family protein [Flavobacteriaceae bacterium UJ101]|nr:putative MscS family protein [Flavobacteriaceae bacterium UJ101]
MNLLSLLQAGMTESAINPVKDFLSSLMDSVGQWVPSIIGALFALIIGLWIIGMIMKAIKKAFNKADIDSSLKPFLITLISFGLKLLLFISIAQIIGIPMASFAVLLGGIGVAIGAAFNGSLGHLASGIMILLFKPFKVGDLIESDGELGFVKEISVFVTVLETFQNKTSIIPNNTIMSNKIINYSVKGNLRVDMPFGIRYEGDIKKAKEIVMDVLKNDSNVLQNPAPRVAVNNLGENGVELLALPYSTPDDYWDVYWDTRQKIVEALGAAGYEAPLPQRVVTMKNS